MYGVNYVNLLLVITYLQEAGIHVISERNFEEIKVARANC